MHVLYNQMNCMCNDIVLRRHTHECYRSIENVKINVGSSLNSELIENQELNVYSKLLNECEGR